MEKRPAIDYILVSQKDRKLVIEMVVEDNGQNGIDHYLILSRISVAPATVESRKE